MKKAEDSSSDFISCIQKLLLSISTVRKHLVNDAKCYVSNRNLKAIKEAISSITPAIETANQLNPSSDLVQHLSNEYSCLCNEYKNYCGTVMMHTPMYNEYRECMEELSVWLTSTSMDLQEVMQSDDAQKTILIIEDKYQALLERITLLNRTMAMDLPDEQAKQLTDELDHIQEQWQILIDQLDVLKERTQQTETIESATSDNLTRQNETILDAIESTLTLGQQLMNQQEKVKVNTLADNEQLLSQIKKCEDELIQLKSSVLESTTTTTTTTVETSNCSLIDQLTMLLMSITKLQVQIENHLDQQRSFIIRLDFLIDWLKALADKSNTLDIQAIQQALIERQVQYDELTKSNLANDGETKEKIECLIHTWTSLSTMIADTLNTASSASSSTVPLLSLCTNEQIVEQAQNLLNTVVQLGNRQEIEQLRNRVQSFLTHYKDLQTSNSSIDLPSNKIYNELANWQLILQQMLIDTARIDHLRVNFVAHFNTTNSTVAATNEITKLIDNYPKEMTTQVRQWLDEQQKARPVVLSAVVDKPNTIQDFETYIKELEECLLEYEQNENNQAKLKKLLQKIEHRPNLPDSLNLDDKQHAEQLQQQYSKLKKHIEDIRKVYSVKKTNIDSTIANIDSLITRIRAVEEQIQSNLKQPIHDYERLILDCQRIITELQQNFRAQVEEAISSGKRLYASDEKDYNTIESVEDTGGVLSSSPSTSLPIKKHSDLTLRKVRRHVFQLIQHWKNVNNNINYRFNTLKRVQTAVEELRRKCDLLHAHLLEIELAYAHTSQIKALNAEQVPAEIEQAKRLLTTLVSCKSSIDDIQQSAQSVVTNYDIHVINRAQELNQRWEHSVASVTQRIQSLQDSIKNTASDIYSSSVEHPWQRAISVNKIPYYINHSDQTTSWDHPKMHDLMQSFASFNDIRFSAYRTAMKLRTLQKRLCLDLTSLNNIMSVFNENVTSDSLHKTIDVTETLGYLQKIFERTSNECPQLINVILTVDMTLNWLLNVYDINRTGCIRLLSVKMALALLCRGPIEDKYRYLFSLVSFGQNGREVVDRQRLSILFQQAIVIPKQLGEVAAFGGSSIEPSVQSCFEYMRNPEVITANEFLEWFKLEPQSLVWLPVMHRLAASEAAKHEARCNVCKVYPILGFRYRSLRHFNCDICQSCFFSGKQTKIFKVADPLHEYYTETTSSEDIRDFFRIFKNKLWAKHRKTPKLGYLPLPHVFDNTQPTNEQPTVPSPTLIPSLTTTPKPDLQNMQKPSSFIDSDDEHVIIAQHCKSLNSAPRQSPSSIIHESLVSPTLLDNDERIELEAIISDLEEENRLLQNEYERLCREHKEKTSIVNEHQEQLRLHDVQFDVYTDREILREAKQLRQYKVKLEQRMKILEEHNKQLEKQMKRSKQLLFRESPMQTLRRSVDRNLERQPNLVTIDNLFHMADDINRAIGDLVSVITEPQSTTPSNHYQQIVTS